MKEIHSDLYEREHHYWWSVIHRKAALSAWRHFAQSRPGYKILDVGCGGGEFLSTLQNYGKTYGIDASLKACEFAKDKKNSIIQADILKLPLRDNYFDAVFALDLIEHIEDEAAVFQQLYNVCSADGLCIVTAPAWGCLWSERDSWLGHKRRYTTQRLQIAFEASGFKVIWASYIYTLLFPALYLRNKIRKILGYHKIKSDIFAVIRPLNSFLINLFSLELKLIPRISLAFGTSVICVAKKSSL